MATTTRTVQRASARLNDSDGVPLALRCFLGVSL
jgi:hypothetical protein